MAKIKISNLSDLTIQNNDNTKTVLTILQENYIDWMHACGAKGRCTTCKFIIKAGMEHLSDQTEAEINYANQNRLAPNERLACQVTVTKGDIEIEIPNSSKLPHIDYSY
jgi:ferredoxin, 2Fe-2S